MSDAVLAAVVGSVVTVLLTFLVPWLLGKVSPVRVWLLDTGHPIRLVVGTSIFCALSASLIVALSLASIVGGIPKIKIEPESDATGAPGFLGQADGSRICVFSTIHKDRENAGETTVKIVGGQWTLDSNTPSFDYTKAKCYLFKIIK